MPRALQRAGISQDLQQHSCSDVPLVALHVSVKLAISKTCWDRAKQSWFIHLNNPFTVSHDLRIALRRLHNLEWDSKMILKCAFFHQHFNTPKVSYSFQLRKIISSSFNLLNVPNNLRLAIDKDNVHTL